MGGGGADNVTKGISELLGEQSIDDSCFQVVIGGYFFDLGD